MALLNLQLCIRRHRRRHSPPLVRFLTPVTAVAVFTAAFPLAAITAITATTFVCRRHLIIDGLRCHATNVDSRSMLPLSFVRVIVCFARVSQIRSRSVDAFFTALRMLFVDCAFYYFFISFAH